MTKPDNVIDESKWVWPFRDEASGAAIWPDKYYAFCDSGGLAGRFEGYESAGLAFRHLSLTHADTEQTYFAPHLLGSACLCVCTGRQFVHTLVRRGLDLAEHGTWSE